MKSLTTFMEEVPASSTTQSSIPDDTVRIKQKADGKFAGCPFFDCPEDKFHNAMQGKGKFKRWKNFLGGDSELANKIRTFKKQNPNTRIMLRNPTTNMFIFANKGF